MEIINLRSCSSFDTSLPGSINRFVAKTPPQLTEFVNIPLALNVLDSEKQGDFLYHGKLRSLFGLRRLFDRYSSSQTESTKRYLLATEHRPERSKPLVTAPISPDELFSADSKAIALLEASRPYESAWVTARAPSILGIQHP